MNYKAASVSSKNAPCTNIPIQCSLCPSPSSGSPQTIWKYNAVNHFIIEHSNSASIPGELLVQMVIRKAEEKAMGIQEQDTIDYREKFAIPEVMALNQRREQMCTKDLGQRLCQLYIHKIAPTISLAKRLD